MRFPRPIQTAATMSTVWVVVSRPFLARGHGGIIEPEVDEL